MLTQHDSSTSVSLSEQRLLLIEEQISRGWQIQLPVIARDAYRESQGWVQILEFVLRSQQGHQTAIAVPAEPAVDRFLQQYNLTIVEI